MVLHIPLHPDPCGICGKTGWKMATDSFLKAIVIVEAETLSYPHLKRSGMRRVIKVQL